MYSITTLRAIREEPEACLQQTESEMRVFRIEGRGNYGAGMAIVAARDMARAKHFASLEINDSAWYTDYKNGNAMSLDGLMWHGSEGVITHFEYGE